MFRVLFYIAIVFLLGLGFAWLAERPGDLVVTFGGYRYEVTLMVAAVLVVAIVAAVMIVWWLLRSIWNSPYAVARYFRVRRRDRGYQALSTGMIAAGAGDGGLARRMGKQASKLISADQEPLIHLLDAQAALLDGDHEAAREKFAAMADDPETRLVGLRGLYLEAERLGEREAARHYASEAARQAPQLQWAAEATLEARAEEGDWQGALALVEAQKGTRQAEREAIARRRAVLLTAKAMEMLDTDTTGAKTAAMEAHRLQPDFVPAAVTAARAFYRLNDLRKGAKVLETVWKKEPHPELADVYVHARPGDSTHDRLARAKKLKKLRPNNVESELAVGRAALDAGEYKEARAAAEAAVRLQSREGAFLLLADIEEAETGDQGRVRHWLAKALRAPRDPAWVADGQALERWAPVSPVTGRVDAVEWRAPVERLGQVVEAEEALAALPALQSESGPRDDAADIETVAIDAEPVLQEPEKEQEEAGSNGGEQPAAPAERAGADEERKKPTEGNDKSAEELARLAEAEEDRALLRPPVPDDPGVDSKDTEKDGTRFRLF
ncbi:heme biosynthesis protein HemY [Nitratireductor luteus]|uniref:heme biosynthesis protein HemY n=1 Tax=Nitratireductor luteus TaxID=2976980 RepID=UPI00223EB008|nr:heme biosynthesis protein HemY [Nitratireductor luteus]